MAFDVSLLHNLPLFEDMEPAAFSRLIKRAAVRNVLQDEAVYAQGADATTVYLLLHGRLKVSQVTPDGQQVIIYVVHPGDLFGLAGVIARQDYIGTARAAVESSVISWPKAVWDKVMENDPLLAIKALQSIAQRLDEANARLLEMSTQEVEQRVARTLLRLVEKAGRVDCGGIRIDFPLSRQDIAEMNGTTFYTVSRVFSSWEMRGLVEGGRQRLTVVDCDGLARIANPAN